MKAVVWIHSINEKDHLTTLDTLCQNKTVKFNIHVKVLTRDSQKECYKRILDKYKDYFSNLELVAEPDEVISDLGRTKTYEIADSYLLNIPDIFMFDDDITRLSSNDCSTPEDVLIHWYNLHNELMDKDENCVMTSVLKDLSKAKPTDKAELYGGICTQCTLLRPNRALRFGIFYQSNNKVGHEDVDYRAQLIKDGKTYYRFPEIIYGTEPLNTDTFTGNSLQERFTRQRDLFKKVWGEENSWILYTTSVINGVELDDVKLDPFCK